jgi:hypothetical protein
MQQFAVILIFWKKRGKKLLKNSGSTFATLHFIPNLQMGPIS